MKKTKFKIILFLIFLLVLPSNSFAAMQSDSYVIHESVMHVFDGPILSNVSTSVSGQSVTVTWVSDILANSFVEYDTDAGFTTSKEQGTSVKNFTDHSVVVSGLTANTLYYYRIKSERINGGITIHTPSSNTFTSGSDTSSTPDPDPPSSSSGGMLIIDKTDKLAPVITNVSAVGLSFSSIKVTWETDEEATSFVEYGPTKIYGNTYGKWGTSTEHSVELINLRPQTTYNFRVLSSDDWGNVGYSDNLIFSTGAGEGEEALVEEEDPAQDDVETPSEDVIINFINRLFPEVSLNQLGVNPLETIRSRADITNLIAAPILSGEPVVNVTATEATIRWTTDITASSLVALAPDSYYNAGAVEPYRQIVGNPETYETVHEVKLFDLSPDTSYHFQLRSKPEFGPMSRSRDFSFRTSLEEITIISFFPQIIDDQTAVFKWVTNKESDSSVTYTPYYDNVLAVDQSRTIKDNMQATIHEIMIDKFVGGTDYLVEIVSMDTVGNVAQENLERFSTAEDDSPPQISYIKADSTIFVDRGNKIQTIISWTTNEPSTSRVFFQEGVHPGASDLSEESSLNTNYSKEHVMVITKFKPGIVYSFRVESIDSGGNVTRSKAHSFMTAKKKESIIQIIMGILENTFGWVKKLM